MTSVTTAGGSVSGGVQPVLDMQQLLDRCLGSLELAERCLVRFTQKLQGEVECVQRCVDADDRVELAQVAHRLKGSAATVSAVSLARAAAALENYARGGVPVDVAGALQEFLHEADRFLNSVPQFSRLGQTGD
ncbi:MAG: Hpt domain-containing protein [Planctomycetaceae bacterium]